MFANLPADRLVHDVLYRAATGIAFLLLSFAPGLLMRRGCCTVLCGLLAVLSVVLRWCSALVGPVLFSIGGMVAGVALALFLCMWFARYQGDMGNMLIMLFLCAVVTVSLYPGILYLGRAASYAGALLLPLIGLWVLAIASDGMSNGSAATHSVRADNGTRRFVLQATALLLCNFASGPVSYAVSALSENVIQLAAAVSLALSAVLVAHGCPREDILFVFFALAACACVAPMVALERVPPWLPSLSSAVFWMVTKYSMAWFVNHGGASRGRLTATSLRGLAAVYLLTACAEALGTAMSGSLSGIVALVAVGVALAIALINAMGSVVSTVGVPAGLSLPGTVAVAGASSCTALDVLAERAHLTEGERGVLEWLSKGYSLKQVAKELGITEGGAKYHRHNVYQKLGVASRQELINLVEATMRQTGIQSARGN